MRLEDECQETRESAVRVFLENLGAAEGSETIGVSIHYFHIIIYKLARTNNKFDPGPDHQPDPPHPSNPTISLLSLPLSFSPSLLSLSASYSLCRQPIDFC